MIRLANVLVVDAARPLAEAQAAALAAAGYNISIPAAGEDPVARAAAGHPDLVLIAEDGPRSLELAAAFRADPATDDIPLLLVAAEPSGALAMRAYAAGFDDLVAVGCGEGELLARIQPLVRLATMHSELGHRAAVAQSFRVPARHRVASADSEERPNLLAVDAAADAVGAALAGAADLVPAADLFEGESLLASRNFDAAVVVAPDAAEDALSFCAQVRHNPRLFNLPIVLLAPSAAVAAEAYRRGASRVLDCAADPDTLRAAVLTLVRRQRLRWAIRTALADSLAPATRDEQTGAYSATFLNDYLAERLAEAVLSQRHLAVVVFSAPNIEGVQRQFGDDAALHLTQQVGQWITGLLRAEDLVARTGPREFCAVLPDTPLAEAEVVMHRIAGVLAYTDFAVRDVYQPVKVWVAVGATTAKPGDDVVQLLARARRLAD